MDLKENFAAIADGPIVFDCCDGCRTVNKHRKLMKTQKRPQRQKQNKVRHVQELRRSNAAGLHKPKTQYNRRWKDSIDWDDFDEELE